MNELLKNVHLDQDDLISSQKSLLEEDNDDWLTLSSHELDQMLEKHYGKMSIKHNGENEAGETKNLSHIITEFLKQKTDFDGVEISANQLVATQAELNKSNNKKKQCGNVEFNPNEFQSAMQNFLDLVIPEDSWDSNSDMSDYDNEDDLEKNLEDMNKGHEQTKTEFVEYLDAMDRELAKTTIASSFENQNTKKTCFEDFDDIEDFQPVDIDANTVKNMMQSYKAQMGSSGPASILLGSLGVQLNEQKKNDKENEEFRNTTV